MSADLDAEADAFVLGLSDERTHAEQEAALEHDPIWSAAVARARDRLLPLDLTAADLTYADLKFANFNSATVTDADFTGTYWHQTIWLFGGRYDSNQA